MPHTTSKAPIRAALLAVLSLFPVSAMAQQGDADALIRRGLSLRRHGHDDQAYVLFEQAWNVSHSARARAQMGLAAQALGRWVDADRLLREALLARDDAWVTERRAVLESSLTEIDAHLGLLELRCNVVGAEVRVDGTLRGTTPLAEALRLPAGTANIQVRAEGHLDVTRQAQLTAGATTREQIDLVPVPTPQTPATPVTPQTSATPVTPQTSPPVAAPTPPPPAMVTPPVVRTPPPSDSAGLRRVLAWTTAGVGVAGVALGAVFLALRNSAAEDFNARNNNGTRTDNCVAGAAEPDCVTAESAVSTRGAVATVGFVAGGAAAVASVVLFLTLPSRPTASAGLRGCAPVAGRDAYGAACVVTF